MILTRRHFAHCLKFHFLSIALLIATNGAAQVLDLPSATNFVKVGDLDVSGNQITVEALIKWSGNSGGNDVVSKHTNPFNVNYLLRPLTFELTTYVSGNSGPTQFMQMTNPFALVVNQWYHIAGTYDGSFVRYYVDGCLVIELPFTGNLCQNNLQTAIGAQSTSQSEQFIGKLDEVRIWNVCRSASEIKANMLDLPSPATQAGLLAYYKFDNDLVNVQGNATYDGVAVGSPQYLVETVAIDPIAIDSVTVTPATCNAIADGSITIYASNANLQYSVDGINYQSSSFFPNMAAGFHTVFVKSSVGCIVDSTIETGIVYPPTLLSVTAAICDGDSYLLPGGNTITVSGIYKDTLYASNGCDSVIITTTLTVNPVTNQNIAAAICPGGSYILPDGSSTALAGIYHDTLSTSTGCDSIIITTLTVLPVTTQTMVVSVCNGDSYLLPSGNTVSVSGIYHDTLTASTGCDSILITDLSVLPAIIQNISASICDGESYQLPSGIFVNTTGIYTDTISSAIACDTIFITSLTVHAALTDTFSLIGITCNGAADATALIIPLSGTAPYHYNWGIASAADTSFMENLLPGSYTVYCTDANGCKDTVSFEITEPALMAVVTTSTPLSQWQSGDATATATVTGGDVPYEFVWNSEPPQFSSMANGLPAGTYYVEVKDANGCIITDSVMIEESPDLLAVPNVFTPNGDGLNDFFLPHLLNVQRFEMQIFNRWGKLEYAATDQQPGWNGKNKGAEAETGIYMYHITATFLDGTTVNKSGSVILLR
ncbi:MAG: gliding motility-associated C-terminal domain-containing protein [Chitinophagales bacterium]|nr:gliding motility-associated C-terminal domain-containing protein [Chitinophagales bacterium]